MLHITGFTCENLHHGCVTDERHPRFSFALESDREGAALKEARLSVNGWETATDGQIGIPYAGAPLRPFTVYTARVRAEDSLGETAEAILTFETGRFDTPWQAKWITDAGYHFTEEKVSPVPMKLRRRFALQKPISSARIYATAMGIYELELNGERVGDEYFAPGFTSYQTRLQYQTYDVTEPLRGGNTLTAVIAGGWAVGAFTFLRKNRITADRQALLLELRVRYADGTEEIIGTDERWEAAEECACRAACLYDGEIYDATVEDDRVAWRQASEERLRVAPDIFAACGAPVKAHEHMKPVSCARIGEELVYDFGQNFAGIVSLRLTGRRGQTVTVRHAEVLNPDGTLNTAILRSARARVIYICRDGAQTFSPKFTYMGFRYIGVTGIDENDIEVEAVALYADIKQIGSFSCSDERLNRLQRNIVWSARSNFVEIPTDCPQRDERMGWTGDIAVFAPTACFNFDLSRFLRKWLLDVRAEQTPGGSIPTTVPAQGFVSPDTMPAEIPVDFWGDACVSVPWALYQSRGDLEILRQFYPMMKKYTDACRRQAESGADGKPCIWDTDFKMHFGDWVAPDVSPMEEWQRRSKWTATASLFHTSTIVSRTAQLLGNAEDAAFYGGFSQRVARAYRDEFTDGNGKMTEEFQTAYALPLGLGMFHGDTAKKAAEHLACLVEKADHCIGTGFPGTPYILFALADNGHEDAAYQMLLNTRCPSWLYEVERGATTIWERWDGLDENGMCPIGEDGLADMVSYNHYASGAVGDFLYRRVAGLEAVEPGYRRFRVKPMIGGGLTEARAELLTPYGRAASEWRLEGGVLRLSVRVPVDCSCEVVFPSGTRYETASGVYEFSEEI